ncbi:MAG TPA: hypothetical protein VLR94_07080 [Acidobacteriota bacterium]|nr:hypothetical protein [Acidobacteriota bacterium]
MTDAIQSYFQAEKSESLLFLGVGIIALGAGIFFLLRGGAFQKGMACPLIAIALIQIVVGGAVYFRTDRQVAGLLAQYQSSAAEYKEQELPRMEKVNRSFDLYKIIEIVLLLAGIALALYFRGRSAGWTGAGLGLSLQAALMLTLDLFAEARADVYTKFIRGL